ncbi:MAG TPA: hypothetical protein VFF80_02610 [Bacillota bacterium]|nr:hypothetical protein [Bacillota bacterium]
MKYKCFSLFVILVTLILFSCKKEKTQQSQSIVGTWELRTGFNGQGGATNYPKGNGRILKFTATSYQIYSNGQILKSGTYELVKDSSYILGKTAQRIIYDNEQNSVRSFVEVVSATLTLTLDAYDAPSALYLRIE